MIVRKKYSMLFVALLAGMLLLMSACGQASGGSSSLSPAEVVQKSIDVMKNVKSAHMVVQSNDSLSASQTGTSGSTGMTLSLKGTGDAQLPDEQFSLTVNPTNVSMAEIVKGDKVYIQNTQGQWYVVDKSVFENAGGTTNPFAGYSFNESDLLGLLAHVQIHDNGDETLNGVGVRHITATLDKNGLQQLLQSYPQAKSLLGNVDLNEVLNRAKNFKSTLDVYIDNTQYYLDRTELKINLTADVTGLTLTPTPSTGASATATPTSATVNVDNIVDLSNFNKPVTITAPANATPTSDPAVIFGGGLQQ